MVHGRPNLGATKSKLILFLVTGAGVGYVPWIPGTIGTILALPLSTGLNRIAAHSIALSLLILAGFILSGVWLCGKGEEILHEKDSRKIVIDEIAGFLIASYLCPPQIQALAAAFVLFRVFDIFKIFPATTVEKIPGGWGIMLDDLIAGLYTLGTIRLFMAWGIL